MTKCEICLKNVFKYKCPTCILKYCSLPCWNKHKESNCQKIIDISSQKEELSEPISDYHRKYMLFTTEDTVTSKTLEQLKYCDPLKNLLENPHLRNLLTEIDSAPDGWKVMKIAMMEPLFIEFADEVLKVIEPPSGADQIKDDFLL